MASGKNKIEKEKDMKVILIGAGNLATHLGKAIFAAGHDVVQVFSRTMQSATALASEVGAQPVSDISDVRSDADLYVVSVKDSAIVELIPVLCKGKETKVFSAYGRLYPDGCFPGNGFTLWCALSDADFLQAA